MGNSVYTLSIVPPNHQLRRVYPSPQIEPPSRSPCTFHLTMHAYTCDHRTVKLQSLPCYCATLRQVARAVTVLYEEVLGDSGLHATQYTALQVLELAPNLTTTELAQTIGIDQTTATRTLALIKRSGLAADSIGSDRRERRWALTSKGQAQLRRLRPRWEAAQEAFEKRLGRVEARALKQASYLAASRLTSN
jgi:DNA-binding MarR family transcriptional regulator